MSNSPQSTEIDRLCRRFEIAVANFGQSCIAMRANEKAFQAWFAASVIQEFGLSRVYREIHLAKKEMIALAPDFEVPQVLREGNELFPDISVSWLPDIDARHSSTRDEDVRLVGDFLMKFALLTELKVTGSGGKSTSPQFIRTDLWKLGLFSLVHARHKVTLSATPASHDLTLRTYMVIMDNFSKGGLFKSAYSSRKLNEIFTELSAKWPTHVEKPTILVLSSAGDRAKMTVYRNFVDEEVS
jgi:hypothetical protein